MKKNQLFRNTLILCFLFLIAACQSDKVEEGGSTQTKTSKTKTGNKFTLLSHKETGIKFSNPLTINLDTKENLISYSYFYNGGGVAIGDLNNDGLPEVLLTSNQGQNKLYLNKGDFKFEDISQAAGIDKIIRWSNGATMTDVNADGLVDIYISNGGPDKEKGDKANELYINNGDLTFTESAAAYGLDGDSFTTQSSFFDYDNDGDLDMLMMNHANMFAVNIGKVFDMLRENPGLVTLQSPYLFRNDGNNTFTNVSKEAGFNHYSYGLGLATSDINQDGFVDVYIANDFSVPDFMFINNGDGTFTDKIKDYTKQVSWYGMGCDIADVNNDALPDIAVVDMTPADHFRSKTLMPPMSSADYWQLINNANYHYQYMFNSFQINNGNGKFSNVANLTGVHQTDWSWATLLADFDNDTDKDYFISNGYRRYGLDNDFRSSFREEVKKYNGKVPLSKRQAIYNTMPEVKLPNLMYRNDGDLHFDNVASDWGLAKPSYSNGAAYGDLDGDGDLDLIVNNIDEMAFVYRNEMSKANNYLQIKLEGSTKGASTFNTKVTLEYDGQKQYQEFSPVRGYQSSMQHLLHFGMGTVDKVDKISLVWPDGSQQVLENVQTNQLLTIKKEANSAIANNNAVVESIFETQSQNVFTHKENEYDDFEKEVLLPHKQSTLGPFISTGDVNGDGRDDFFIGGAKGQAGKLIFSQANGSLKAANSQPWRSDKECEDMGSCFFDADKDGDLDLYVVSGGNEVAEGSALLQDRLYLNNGKGSFTKGSLPALKSSGQQVKANDFDGDGDLDLLVTGRAIPAKYPYPDRTFLLENNNGKFKDITEEKAPDLMRPGIATDFVWTDFNGDNKTDLVLVGEWMPVQFYENTGNGFAKSSERKDLKGWWYSIAESDLDKDGDLDLVLGNIGQNNKFQVKAQKPLYLYCNDFDESGSFDIVLSKTYKDRLVPTRGRQCSSEQMPFITEKYPTYTAFANASLEDMYGKDKLEDGLQLEANEMKSLILWNERGTYKAKALPVMAQIAPVNGIVIADVNKDDLPDLITGGNMFHTEVETQRYDAGQGAVWINQGNQEFKFLTTQESGFYVPNDVKDLKLLKNKEGLRVLVANNNGPLEYFSLKK